MGTTSDFSTGCSGTSSGAYTLSLAKSLNSLTRKFIMYDVAHRHWGECLRHPVTAWTSGVTYRTSQPPSLVGA